MSHVNVTYTVSPPPPYVVQPGPTPMPTLIVSTPVGPAPIIVTCPSCNAQIVTRTERKANTRTHITACILLILIWPLVCLPYCMSACNNVDHYCPNCNAYIGGYKF